MNFRCHTKTALQVHLKRSEWEALFGLEYDLLLYGRDQHRCFEGSGRPSRWPRCRGYSRDQRSDCKQVCIGLVVSRCGMPLGYEVFAGNTADVTTVEQIVTLMEQRYGKSHRIWVMDRGMVSEKNLAFLRLNRGSAAVSADRRTPKGAAEEVRAAHLLSDDDWHTIREGIEVKLLPVPPETRDDDDDHGAADRSDAAG